MDSERNPGPRGRASARATRAAAPAVGPSGSPRRRPLSPCTPSRPPSSRSVNRGSLYDTRLEQELTLASLLSNATLLVSSRSTCLARRSGSRLPLRLLVLPPPPAVLLLLLPLLPPLPSVDPRSTTTSSGTSPLLPPSRQSRWDPLASTPRLASPATSAESGTRVPTPGEATSCDPGRSVELPSGNGRSSGSSGAS
jgi:hypothetical protein